MATEPADGDADATEPSDVVRVVVDTREPDVVMHVLFAHPDVDRIREAELPAADLVVNGVGIERKTPSDYSGALTEGRLVEQADKLVDAYDHRYLLLEGSYDHIAELRPTELDERSARGMGASLTARYGIPVVPTGGDPLGDDRARRDATAKLVDYALRLGRKHTEAPVSDHLPTGDVGSSEPPAKRMWGCLPGVGPTLADRLYAEIGTPQVLGAGDAHAIDQLTAVEGIGEPTAQRIFDALWDREREGGSDA